MKNKGFLKNIVVLTAIFAVLGGVVFVSQAQEKPGRFKPLPATDTEIVKKVSLINKGKSANVGSKKTFQATTGISGALAAGNKYAVVIGIDDYPGTANDLVYTDDDAREMSQTLTQVYGYNPENIHLLIGIEASVENIQNAINDIKEKARTGDEVVFFFSGHGGKGRASDGDKEAIDESIISHDGNPNGMLYHIWDGQLKLLFSEFQTSRIIFIFDSCLSGGMTDLSAPGRIINMATTETGTAYESDAWQNGQFTYYFVDQGMIQGLADTHDYAEIMGNEPTSVEEAFDYAKTKSVNQTPTIKDLFINDLLL